MKKFTLLLLMLFLSFAGYSQLALESFESTTGPNPLPSTTWPLVTGNWAVFDNGVGLAQRWGINNTISNTGTNSAYINRENIGMGNTSEDYLSTPLVTIPANGQLRFFARTFTAGDQGTLYQLKVAPAAASQTNPAAYTLVQQWTEDQLSTTFNVFEEKVVDLSAYAGQQIYVSFVMRFTQPTTALGGDRWLLDDVRIVEKCADPTILNATGITLTSANLSWVNPSGSTSWEIEVLPALDNFTGVGIVYNGVLPYLATTTATGANLTPGTPYKYYVRSICNANVKSNWVGPYNFSTLAPGLSCTAPITVGSLPYSTTDNTANYSDNPNIEGSPGASGCGTTGNYLNGNDVVYSYTASFTGIISVTMTPLGTNSGVFAYNSCNAIGNACLAGVANATTSVREFNLNVTSGQTYYFVLSSLNTTQTYGYTLVIQKVNCLKPSTLSANTILKNSAQLSWANTGGYTSWEVAVQLAGSPIPSGSGVATSVNTDYLASGLLSGTNYQYYVRANCGDGTFSEWAGPFLFMTAPDYCAGNHFFDSGGVSGNYSNNENITTTICPDNAGDVVTVSFNTFNTQAGVDLLRVYNGTGTAGTLLGTFSGTTLPANMTSSAPDGCLTFVFTSNATTVASGWDATITCGPPPACPAPIVITSSNITSNSVTVGWTNVGPATAWEVIALPCGSALPTASSTGWVAAPTNPFVLSNLDPAFCYDIYVRSKCSPTSLSTWTGTATITTLVAPPICGGNFVDSGSTTANYANNEDIVQTITPPAGQVVTVTFTSFDVETNNDGLYVFDGNSITAPQISSGNPAGGVPGGVPGAFWGTTNPGPFTSSAPDGSLTFRFRSNGTTTRPGWISNIACTPAPACPKPYNVLASNVTFNGVTLSWTNVGPATIWEILALPAGSPAPGATATGFVTAPTNPFVLTGLNSATAYDIYVRSNCGAGTTSGWTIPVKVTTPPNYCAGDRFFDSGGATGNYSNNENITTLICPSTPGEVVTVVFNTFNTQAGNDLLKIYDGDSVAAPLIGTFSGTAIPSAITSTAVNGCLTFVFTSNATTVAAGWDATIICSPPPTCVKPTNLTVSNITPTSAVLGWTQTGTVPQWEVLILPQGSPSPLPSATGIFVTTNPFQITGLDAGTKYVYFVRAVCNPGDKSFWSTGLNFETPPINDECSGATFVPVNADQICNQVVPGTIAGATASGLPLNAPCNTGTPNDDVWFQFIATNSYLNISLLNVLGSTNLLNHAVYSGNCGNLTQLYCSTGTALNSVANNLTVGQTYYIRVYSNGSIPQTTTFNVCISTPSTCSNAATVCNITYNNTTGVTSLGTIGCLSTTPNPTYFTIQVQQSGPIKYTLTQNSFTGAPLDVDYVAWGPFTSQAAGCTAISTGTAAPLTGQTTGCSYSAAATEFFNINNAVAGQFYILLITNFSNQPGIINLQQNNSNDPGAGQTSCCPEAKFSYAPATYCKTSTVNPTPIIAPGSLAGNFTSTAGLVFVSSATGQINLAASAPGNYVVTNTLAPFGSCNDVKTFSYTVSITDVGNATISYDNPSYCNSTSAQVPVNFSGTGGGTYSVSPPGLYINPATGALSPNLSAAGNYTVTYKIAAGGGCAAFTTTTQVSIIATPVIPQPINRTACNSYVLPALSVGNYFTGTGGTGTQLAAGTVINTSQTIFVYAVNGSCTSEKSFNVTINNTPSPVVNITSQPSCAVQTGSIEVTSPTGGFLYFVDNGAYQSSPVFTGLTPGSHTVTAISTATFCFSLPTTFTIDPVPFTNPVTTFSYASPVCKNNATNPMPDTSASGFVSGGVYSSTAGLTINPTTGEIDLATSTVGTYTVTYSVNVNNSTCQNAGSSTATITINPVVTPNTGFSYTTPVCKNAGATLTPNLASGFTTGGTFSSTSGLVINSTTGIIDLVASAAGSYVITYNVNANPSICQIAGSSTFTLVINPTITPVTSFSYATPVCSNDPNVSPVKVSGFTNGGVFSSTAGLSINSLTGEINLVNSTPGTYTITYSVAANASTCQVASSSTSVIVISNAVEPSVTGECQGSNYVLLSQPLNNSYNPATATYVWKDNSGNVIGNTQNITVTSVGSYSLTVTSSGCSGTATFTVDLISCVIQKGISPNGDNKNDFFDLQGLDVKLLSIYNRYGTRVYSLSNYTKEWYGQSDKGNELPDGTYYYVIEQRNGETKSGWIYINREIN